jgi:hypothetical protein
MTDAERRTYDTWRDARRREASEDVTFWPLWLAEDVDGISVYTMALDGYIQVFLKKARREAGVPKKDEAKKD